jgi:hypothetical protein
MVRFSSLVVLLGVASGNAWAQIPPLSGGTPSYVNAFTNAQMTWKTGAVTEVECDDVCSVQLTAPLKAGYSPSSAVIFMRMYYINFSQSGGDVNHVQLMLEKNSYNATTGDFTYTITAALTDNTTPNRHFRWGVWFTMVVGDNVTAIARQKTLNNFEQAGSPGTPCDSTSRCEDTTTLSSIKTSTTSLHGVLIRGFDVYTNSGVGMQLSELVIDSTGYSPTSTGANGSTVCGLESTTTTDDIYCEVGLSTLAYDSVHMSAATVGGSYTGLSGDYYTTETAFSPVSSPNSFLVGLKKTVHTSTSGDIHFGGTVSGTGAFSLYPGSPPYVQGQGSFGFEPYTGTSTYSGQFQSYVGFVY